MKSKDIDFRVPIYDYNIKVVLTDDINAYCKEFGNVNPSYCIPAAKVLDLIDAEVSDTVGYDFITIFELNKTNEGDIVHETMHLVARMMRYIGMPLVRETEEAYCYLQDFLFGRIKQRLLQMKVELNSSENDTDQRKEVPEATSRPTTMEGC